MDFSRSNVLNIFIGVIFIFALIIIMDIINFNLNTKNLLSLAYAPRLDPSDMSEPTAERTQLGFLPIFYYKIDFKAKKKE